MKPEALSVTQCIEVLNTIFDQVGSLAVEGEVSELRIIHNKWVTFQLKDEESTLPCFMTVWQMNTQFEDGMTIRVQGNPRIRNKGFFSFVVQSVTPTGEGALARAFALLQKKLEGEGLFAPERKRALPPFPEHIALITSEQAAAYGDFLKVLRARQGGLTISFIHTQVQGEEAPTQLLQALETANTDIQNLDAIVMIRGGGSMEDLAAFNDERVVRAVAASRTPIIVGIGHERDVTLAELAADVRASTPSNAAELLVRTRAEITADIHRLADNMGGRIHDAIQERSTAITHYIHSLSSAASAAVATSMRVVDSMYAIARTIHDRITFESGRIESAYRILVSLSPEKVLARGYSITRNTKGAIVRHSTDTRLGDTLVTTFHEGTVKSDVTEISS